MEKMRYESGMRLKNFAPWTEPPEDEVIGNHVIGPYIGASSWDEYRLCQLEIIGSMQAEMAEAAQMIDREKDELARIDYENIIRRNELFIRTRDSRLADARKMQNYVVFGRAFMGDGRIEPIWERVGKIPKEIMERDFLEMLDHTYV